MLLNCLSELVHATELDTVNAVAVSDSCLIALDDTIWHWFLSHFILSHLAFTSVVLNYTVQYNWSYSDAENIALTS